jgi:hypothetical protein
VGDAACPAAAQCETDARLCSGSFERVLGCCRHVRLLS